VTTSSLEKALLAFEPLATAEAAALGEQHGITALQCHATSDLGLVAYQSDLDDGFIVDESVIVEVVDPGSGKPVPPGHKGEMVVTAFNPDYPLIRFATGSLTKQLPGESRCGRTNMRLAGVLGEVLESTTA
jgi:phenylacetate-CoA ligase